MTRLQLIRHGETDWNRRACFQGQLDVPLNATGAGQALALASRLAGEPPDAFYCSDLIRAQQTAAPLAAAWQMQPMLLPALREQAFGVFEGLDFDAIQVRHAALWQRWLAHSAEMALPGGGESMAVFSARVLTAVDTLIRSHPGLDVAIVTHGGVLDVLWRNAQGLPLAGPRTCDIPNTGINRMCWADGRLAVSQWADAMHLVA